MCTPEREGSARSPPISPVTGGAQAPSGGFLLLQASHTHAPDQEMLDNVQAASRQMVGEGRGYACNLDAAELSFCC